MSEDKKEFITREIFDANILAIREAMAASEARHERIAAEMRTEAAEMRTQYTLTQMRLDNMDKRIDNMKNSLDKFFRNTGLALTGMTLLFTALQISLSLITIMK
ncbi:MAG: hypothetical protein IJS99_03865 [Synergistaceae bacterium]|nr:hypothetical protein [Synergistaceae bacterium]